MAWVIRRRALSDQHFWYLRDGQTAPFWLFEEVNALHFETKKAAEAYLTGVTMTNLLEHWIEPSALQIVKAEEVS